MYRHLLVPIDATDLSIEVVGNAVALARKLGARISFFHACADASASLRGEMEVLRLTSIEDYDYAVTGRARELLSKAQAGARASGVACDASWTVSDKPAEAIVAAARAKGCDLIFMASHGHASKLAMALASNTLTVLKNAGLPVLVCATGELQAPARAIGVIRDEHRAMAAVMHAWTQLLAQARSSGTGADPVQMRAIVQYLRNFPMALHHPKEEQHLFPRLRARTGTVDAELDELQRQHERDRLLVAQLAAGVEAIAAATDPAGQVAATRELEQAVGRYADFHWEHMGREEAIILPAAQQHLTDADWVAIDAAFSHAPDIRAGAETDLEYRHLIARIVSLSEGAAGAA